MIAGCKAGRHSSYEALHKRFYRILIGIALRYCASRDEAEDIVQESFIKVFQHITTYNHGSFEGWIKRIVHNTAINHYRAGLRFNDVDENELKTSSDDSFEKIAGDLDVNAILVLLNKMPEGYRLLLNLYAIDGYSHHEIAHMLNISIGTSKSQLHKARKYLKELLKNDYQAYTG